MSSDDLLIPDSQPNRADAVKNRRLLLDTARRLFAEHGVEAVSMTAIAEAAGVGKGTLYRHFESKGVLCHALLDTQQRDLQDRCLSYFRANMDDPRECLYWFLGRVVEFVDEYAELLSVRVRDSGLTTLSHPAHFWWRQTVRGLLERLNPTYDVEYVTDVLYIMLDAHVIHYQRHTRDYSPGQLVDGLVHLAERLST
ncbi:MAG: TetR/AcrR family transcriptional regulator [Anaerolineae bacterium]|nr:TetR/AcrR family transcriptional regulator [Anaerolineae bacterium]